MLSKKDLKLIGEFVDKGNLKEELNFALIGNDSIVATDTRRAISFNVPDLKCEPILAHKRVLKLAQELVSKDDFVKISPAGTIDIGFISIPLSNANLDMFKGGEFSFPDMSKILGRSLPHHFTLTSLDDIVFELSQQSCFIKSSMLCPLIEYGDADWYEVFYESQNGINSGMVKIVAMRVVDDADKLVYTAVVMGRVFISEAKGF